MEYVETVNTENIKRRVLIKYPFFGSVFASIKFKEKKGLGTAGTNGKTIYYDPEFLSELNEDEQTFIFAHEIFHIAFDHILRSEGKNPRIWNIATDAVINQFLKKDGLPFVKGGVDIVEAINYDAEKLYDKLLKEEQEKQQQSQQEKTGPENNDVGHDTHSLWEEAVKRHKEGKDLDDEEEEKEQDQSIYGSKDERLKEMQDKMTEMGEKEAFKKNEQTRKEQLEELLDTLSRESKGAGTTTNSEVRDMEDIGTSKPLIDWRLWLREAISMDVDWSYQNAEIEDGVVRPNLEAYPIPETEILLDTSGSIDKNLLKNFLRECKNILQASRVKVGCFDTKFYEFTEIRSLEDIDNLEYIGGGGTDFNVAVNAFTRKVENKIIFTDGDAPMPGIAINAIWVVFGGKKINPKGGKVIHITGEQLRKLCFSYKDEQISINRRI